MTPEQVAAIKDRFVILIPSGMGTVTAARIRQALNEFVDQVDIADDALPAHEHDYSALYAPVVHEHDYSGTYAPLVHEHDYSSLFAAINHAHNYADTYAALNHSHDGLYSPLGHGHDSRYALLTHTHDYSAIYAPLTHHHDGRYALAVHDHDALYAALNHAHDYAPLVHTHDYAATNHLHDGRYSLLGHTHDYSAVYAPLNHTHNYAATSHLHDERYSQLGHTHDYSSTYAPLVHEHDTRYYTQTEVDNLFTSFGTNLLWKAAVETFADLATTYPAPQDNWTVPVNDELTDYRWDQETGQWINLGSSVVPLATRTQDGRMSSAHYIILDDLPTTHYTRAQSDAAYAAIGHSHDYSGLYAPLVHEHDYSGTYAALNHQHDSLYAPLSHSHDYAETNHHHDSLYAPLAHSHDYAATNHLHDGRYSQLGHTHDYAATNHTHDYTAVYAPLAHVHTPDQTGLLGSNGLILSQYLPAVTEPQAPTNTKWNTQPTVTHSGTTVSVSSGQADFNGVTVNYTAANFTIAYTSPGLIRQDAVVAKSDSTYQYVTGTAGSTAATPVLPAGTLWVAYVIVTDAGATVQKNNTTIRVVQTTGTSKQDVMSQDAATASFALLGHTHSMYALDNAVVKLSGAQTVEGAKTWSGNAAFQSMVTLPASVFYAAQTVLFPELAGISTNTHVFNNFKIPSYTGAENTRVANTLFDFSAYTTASAGTHSLFTQIAIKAPVINANTTTPAGVTNAATLYIERSPWGSAAIANSYALWVDGGLVRLDGNVEVGGSITEGGTDLSAKYAPLTHTHPGTTISGSPQSGHSLMDTSSYNSGTGARHYNLRNLEAGTGIGIASSDGVLTISATGSGGGGAALEKVAYPTANYTVPADITHVISRAGADITITLPAATLGKKITLTAGSTGNLTISPMYYLNDTQQNGQCVAGATLVLIGDGTNWFGGYTSQLLTLSGGNSDSTSEKLVGESYFSNVTGQKTQMIKKLKEGAGIQLSTDVSDNVVITSTAPDASASPSAIAKMWAGTQAQYDAIATKDTATLYHII